MNLVDNPEKAFNEVFRILKPGGQAIFSIWGKIEEFNYFNSFRDTMEKIKGTYKPLPYFNLHDDMDGLKTMLSKAGFKNFKKEYTNCLCDVYSAKEYIERLKFPHVDKGISTLNDEQLEKFNIEMEVILKEFEKSEKFVNLNVFVFSVFK